MRTQSLLCGRCLWALAAIVAALVALPAQAINFELVYRGPGSANPLSFATSHAEDPDGAKLMAHMERAADDWSSILRDNWDIRIDVYYADASRVSTMTANAPILSELGQSHGGYRTTVGRVQVFDAIDAWFDPTPNDDSEFTEFSQTLLRDLSPPKQDAGFDVSSGDPGVLEVGYSGSGGAGTQWDLVTILRHEIGHLVGFNSASLAEGADGDFDIAASLLGGAEVGVMGAPNSAGDPVLGHLESERSLMSGTSQQRGVRRAISTTDVFSAVTGSGWSNVVLPRVDYVGNPGSPAYFDSPAVWINHRMPAQNASVAIRNGGLPFLSSDDRIRELLLGDASQLTLLANTTLQVDQTATIGTDGNDSLTRLNLLGGAEFNARGIRIDAGQAVLEGGILKAERGLLVNHGVITGAGTIDVYDGLENNGTVRSFGGLLVIGGRTLGTIDSPPAVADLDGANRAGIVDANQGSIRLDIRNAPLFRGIMQIGAGQYVDMQSDWELGTAGELTLTGTSSQPAVLRGADLVVGSATVNVNGHGRFEVPIETQTFASSMNVANAGDKLTFADRVTYDGGRHEGEGTHVYMGALLVNSGVINVGTIEFGPAGSAAIAGGSVTAKAIRHHATEMQLAGGTLQFGTLEGNLEHLAGTLVVDDTTVLGDLSQHADARLQLEIGGTSKGEFGTLTIEGQASLAGTLDVSLAGGFLPGVGDTIEVVSAGQLYVDKDLKLTGSAAGHFKVEQTDTSITLTSLAVYVLKGDYNDDGVVDAADYTVWRNTLGQSGVGLAADGDASGTVDESDYKLWRGKFGTTAPSALAGTNPSPVPEPTSAALLALLAVVLPGLRQLQRGL